MDGYWTSTGYVGYVSGRMMLFASDTEYYEYLEESAHARLHDIEYEPQDDERDI